MRENGPLLSRVVDPPGTKGGPRAGNFPGPPKNTFCPGWWLHPGQKAPILYMCAPCSSSPNTWFYVPLFPAKGRNAISKLFLGALLQIPRTLTQYLDLFLNFCSELVNSFKNRRKIIKMQIRTFWNPCE